MAVTCLFPEFSQASFYGQAPLERGKPRDVVLLDVRVAESRGMTCSSKHPLPVVGVTPAAIGIGGGLMASRCCQRVPEPQHA